MNEQKNIQNFLEQQKTLFGNELFLNKTGQIDDENITLSTGQNGKRDLAQFCNSISLLAVFFRDMVNLIITSSAD